ncbi:hypothetical protein [Magnetospirillum sulfuroxidans]|uniref:Transposase n=1 Tax=Magnetospirillum sulfuroxidans TaxID=611300 RepID=A0ABS5I850_9PROT|nr:hypothetical protein [Magnetospirillum sulfuroxidans]MBR9970615.1 hypothetical protein [Magnetospirillum sulfuroxidans]
MSMLSGMSGPAFWLKIRRCVVLYNVVRGYHKVLEARVPAKRMSANSERGE